MTLVSSLIAGAAFATASATPIVTGGDVNGTPIGMPLVISGASVTASPVGATASGAGRALYSNTANATSARTSGLDGVGDGVSALVSYDDYTSIAAGDFELSSFVFIGGVSDAGGVLVFEFYDTADQLRATFGVQLAEAGTFTWTVSFDAPLMIAQAGRVVMLADDEGMLGTQTTGAFLMGVGDPAIGSTSGFPGLTEAGQRLDHKFELIGVPTPGAAVVAIGGALAALRRRR